MPPDPNASVYGIRPHLPRSAADDALAKRFADALVERVERPMSDYFLTDLRDLDAAEKADLDEWRASYGRLDIPVTVIDWRPVYAGAAALGIALAAHWVVRHGR